jgi:hypothetical protein
VIEQRMVVVARNAEGICFFKEQSLGRGSLAFEAFLALDVLVLKLRGVTLDLKNLRTTRVQPSEAGKFEEEVGTMLGVTEGDVSCT